MVQNVYLSVSKLTVIILLCLVAGSAFGQRRPKHKPPESEHQKWLKTQWWIGIRAGTNLTQANPVTRYSSLNPINYDAELLEKTYIDFSEPGIFLGLDLSFYHRGFSLALTPGFKMIKYSYSSELEWTGDTESATFQSEYNITQRTSFIELPLSLRYELMKSTKLRPYLMVGTQYSFALGATKDAQITHTDFITGTAESYDGGTIILDVKQGFQNYFGLLGGIGFNYDIGNVRTILEVSYTYGLSSITDSDQRYSEDELVTLGETNDEINANGINASLSIVFPLRYIDKTFSSK